jgi:hypothetical protein
MFFMLVLSLALPAAADAQVRNSGFGARGPVPPYFTQANVENFRKSGWQCPDAAEWPQWWWSLYGKAGTVQFPHTGGVQADGFAKLAGTGVYLAGYHGLKLEERNYVYAIWARGKGRLHLHVLSYGQDDSGTTIQLVKPGQAAEGKSVAVQSGKWVRYRHLLVKTPRLWNVHPFVGVENGSLDLDEIEILPSTPGRDLIVKEEATLYGTGALIEDKEVVKADAVFAERRRAYQDALAAFAQAKGALDQVLVASLEAELKTLAPYVLTEGLSAVRVPSYNEMLAATRVLNTLAGKQPEKPAAISATELVNTLDYVPGRRDAKQDGVLVTAIEPNKILYEENETATVRVRVKNTKATEQKVTLVARQRFDLDSAVEVGRGSLSVPAGGETTWTPSYNVGPETFGRALEVQVFDEAGREVDRWQEYYHVAREWLRVQMHTQSRYYNMGHYFANEPTDWGVQPTDAEQWISGQAGYRIIPAHRQAAIKHAQQRGTKLTFYQNLAFGGIMGYEEMRQHPEYVLYDANGQFAVDPIYGGYPNPMELASPIEVGPKRKDMKIKPHLDRQYTPWQHAPANWAMPGCIEYGAACIRDYAKRHGFDGIFIDGTIWIMKGYGYDGKINLPADKADAARRNTQVQETFFRILKAEAPHFGTWFNHSIFAVEFWRRTAAEAMLGSGLGEGESDIWIRGMHDWKNVSCLDESVGQFNKGDSPWCYPAGQFERLCKNRDYIVQQYGGNAIIGYLYHLQSTQASPDQDKPGPAKWGWPALNYFMAQTTATQHHVVFNTWPTPSLEPAFQFQTRYSRLLWAPDIKLVPDAERTVTVTSPQELWWKRLVYRRHTAEGHDLIVHLVRIPPFEKWDTDWVDEPAPLTGVTIAADLGGAKLKTAQACRPHHFEEPQQTVQTILEARIRDGRAAVTVPAFRYHTMVVFRFARSD